MEKIMNVAFVNSTKKWGGEKTWCIDTATEFEKLGVKSVLFGKDPRFTKRAGENGIEAHQIHFGFDYNPLLVGKFLTFFIKRKINCVFVNVGKDLKSAGLAARLAGIPVILRCGSPGDIRSSLENLILHYTIRPSVMCCSEYTRKGLLHNLPYLTKFNTTSILPGVKISSHSLTLHRRRTFITTSQLNKDKRHKDIIDACKILADAGLDFALIIVGEGKLFGKLTEQVDQLGLNDHVHFTGYTSEVEKKLLDADFFILPSYKEPLGIALEEAMAGGLIPVARNAGGVPEIWPKFLPDHLLPQTSTGVEFAQLLSKLIHLPETQVNDLKHMVREHARESFSRETQSKHVLKFIESLLIGNKFI